VSKYLEKATIALVARRHRIPFDKAGPYNPLVCTCPECWRNYCDHQFDIMVGFTAAPFPDRMMGSTLGVVYECPECHARWWTHAFKSTYERWLERNK